MAKVEGYCNAPFEKLKELLEARIANGEELGASMVLNIDGKNVVDIWGGHADEEKTKPWDSDTITAVWSSTKTVATFACLLAHERGLINFNEPVAKYWPEFADNGKDKVLVRHVMVPLLWRFRLAGEDHQRRSMRCAPKPRRALAKQAPWWEPGTASGYHSVTMGHLLGEIIRRATGKPHETIRCRRNRRASGCGFPGWRSGERLAAHCACHPTPTPAV